MSSLASNRSETPRAGDDDRRWSDLSDRAHSARHFSQGRHCDFPPLRVELTRPRPAGSLFEHQHKLKLTAFCKSSRDFQQKVLLEYAAYRLYNLMTPQSFRARLATVDYLDETGRPYISRVGFFVEDVSDVAKRNGLSVAKMGSLVPLQQIDPVSAARTSLVRRLDQQLRLVDARRPEGPGVLPQRAPADRQWPGSLLTVVPYDFDFSGLVDAPYADPPEGIPVNSVRQRTYRGYCSHLSQARRSPRSCRLDGPNSQACSRRSRASMHASRPRRSASSMRSSMISTAAAAEPLRQLDSSLTTTTVARSRPS